MKVDELYLNLCLVNKRGEQYLDTVRAVAVPRCLVGSVAKQVVKNRCQRF